MQVQSFEGNFLAGLVIEYPGGRRNQGAMMVFHDSHYSLQCMIPASPFKSVVRGEPVRLFLGTWYFDLVDALKCPNGFPGGIQHWMTETGRAHVEPCLTWACRHRVRVFITTGEFPSQNSFCDIRAVIPAIVYQQLYGIANFIDDAQWLPPG